MADNIIKLRVDSNEYEGKIKRASEGLQALGRSLRDAGKTFADADAKQVEFTSELGKMQTVSNTAKGKVAEMSAAFVNLKSQYLQMTDAERQSPIGQAMSKSLEQLKTRTIEAKRELESLNKELNETKNADVGGKGGGLFGGSKLDGMLQVFGGNLMTKAAGMAAGLATEIGDAVKQGIELAKQGDGIRIAFERLGRGDILDGLREATHGTVTDIELMKAAVKFNDFKLPIEELGTMLAFAQQKAKDTGQSVDYMVDSIVTGLGRKSLMILDNLGLSATEVKEKMAETGDMTKAVGAIIREQMAKAGDYVETAADRAQQANVSLQNKMEELGRKFAPLEEASNNFWTSMKIGILDVIGGPLTHLLNKLTQAGRLMNAYGQMGGNAKVGRMTANLAGTSEGNRQNIYAQQQAQFWRYINKREQYIKDIESWQRGNRSEQLSKRVGAIQEQYGILDTTKIRAEVDAAKKMLSDYQQAAKAIMNPLKEEASSVVGGTTTNKGGKGGGKTGTVIDYAPDSIKAQQAEVQRLTSLWQKAGDSVRDDYKKQLDEAQFVLDRMTGKEKFDPSKLTKLQGVSVAPNTALPDLKWADISKQKQEIQAELKVQQVKVDEETLKTLMKDAVQNGINGMDFQFAILGEKIGRGIDVPDSEWQKIVDEYNKMREQIGLEPVKINFETGGLKEAGKDAKTATKDFSQAASAISSVGSALQSIEDPGAKVAGIVAQAIATVASSFASALHTDGTTKSNIWAFIGAAAASTAAMVSMISTIHSSTGYAHGGIVKGNSYSGDNIAADSFVNAGELILSRSQQLAVASQLQNNSPLGGGRLVARLKGADLLLSIERELAVTGKGQLATFR